MPTSDRNVSERMSDELRDGGYSLRTPQFSIEAAYEKARSTIASLQAELERVQALSEERRVWIVARMRDSFGGPRECLECEAWPFDNPAAHDPDCSVPRLIAGETTDGE